MALNSALFRPSFPKWQHVGSQNFKIGDRDYKAVEAGHGQPVTNTEFSKSSLFPCFRQNLIGILTTFNRQDR